MPRPPRKTNSRKNFVLTQYKIDRARRILGVSTETEAIERALDAVIDLEAFRRDTDAALTSLAGAGDLTNYFDPPSAIDRGTPARG